MPSTVVKVGVLRITMGTPNEGQKKLPFMVDTGLEGTPAYFLNEADAVEHAGQFAVATVKEKVDGKWKLHPANGFNGRVR